MTQKQKSRQITKTNMTVNIDMNHYEFLKRLSYRLSMEETKKIGLSEIVRRALDKHYPIDMELEKIDI